MNKLFNKFVKLTNKNIKKKLIKSENVSQFNNCCCNNNLNIFYQNIRSFNKNFNELEIYLTKFKTQFHIIILVEIWKNFEYSIYKNITGYNNIYITNKENKNAGVVIYIKNDIKFEEIIIKKSLNNKMDIIGIKILNWNLKNKQNIYIIGIYKHHRNI